MVERIEARKKGLIARVMIKISESKWTREEILIK
jgi:hypothetical protein